MLVNELADNVLMIVINPCVSCNEFCGEHTEEVGHSHVNRARMQLSRRGLHARVLTSSGHCLVLLGCKPLQG